MQIQGKRLMYETPMCEKDANGETGTKTSESR
jgi:hypothetical protein